MNFGWRCKNNKYLLINNKYLAFLRNGGKVIFLVSKYNF